MLSALIALGTFAQAATVTWTGGGTTDNWSDADNWGGTLPVAGDALVFAGVTRLTPVNDLAPNTSFTSISFSVGAGNFLISGAAVTLSGGATALNNLATSGMMTVNVPVIFSTTAPTITSTAGGALVLAGAVNNGDLLVTVAAGGPVTMSGALSGAGGLTKTGADTLTLAGLAAAAGSNYAGATVIGGGTLAITNTSPTLTGSLTMGLTAGSAIVSALDLSSASLTCGAFVVRSNSASTNTVTIGGGRTFTTGSVTVGTAVNAATTLLTVTGAGAWVVNAPAGFFWMGGYNPVVTNNSNQASIDLSGLATFTVDVTTGSMLLGRFGDNATRTGTMTLATDSTIRAATLTVGESGSGSPVFLRIGAGTTLLHVDTLNVGTGGRDYGSITFAGGTGSVQVRNRAGTGRANVNIQTGSAGTGYVAINTIDFSGHAADLLLNNLIIGGQPRSGAVTNTITFDSGTFDVTTVRLGERSGTTATANTHASTINLGGGSVVIGTGGLQMAANTATGGTANALNAVVNISGANVTIANNAGIGAAVRMANNSAGSGGTTANGTLNLTAGSLTVAGNIILGATSRPATATLTLNGATLNGGNAAIGSGAATVTSNFQSGTLSNIAQVNGGGTVTKSTAGTLVLTGTNSWTGGTVITAGVLQTGAANALPLTSDLTVTATLDLAGNSGAIDGLTGAGSVTSSAAGTGVLTVGSDNGSSTFSGVISNGIGNVALTKIGSGTHTLAGANTYTGATTISAGTLRVTGSTAAGSAVSVLGGFLDGSGTINGSVTTAAGGTVAPGLGGATLATLTTGAVSLAAGGGLVIDLDGGAIPTADLLSTTAAVQLGGTLTVNSVSGSSPGAVFTIVSAGGGLSGTCAGLPQGAIFIGSGHAWQVNYDYIGGVVTLTEQSSIWDGGGTDDNWQTAANWVGNVAPTPGASLVFGGNLRTTPINNFTAGTEFASISFTNGAGNFTLSGNAVTLTGGSVVNFATSGTMTCDLPLNFGTVAPVITTAAGGTIRFTDTIANGGLLLTIANEGPVDCTQTISGSGGLTKSGSGTVVLTAANAYTGLTTISAGTLQLGDGITDGTIAATAAVVNNGALSYVILANRSVPYVISGTGSLAKSGPAILTLTSANTYSGTTTITAGTLAAGVATQAFGVGSSVVIADAADAVLDLAGFDTTIGSVGGGGVTGGAVVLGAVTLITGGNNSSSTFAGVISGTGGVNKTGSGTMTYGGTAANTYTGVTTITDGTLVLQKTAGINSIAGDITIGDAVGGDVLRLGANNQIVDTSVITCVSGGAGNSAKFELNGYLETITGIQSNANQASVLQNTESGGAAGPSNPAILTISGDADYVFDGIIRNGGGGTMGLAKSGAGLLTLRCGFGAGLINYSGLTTLSAGRLLIDNLSNFSSAVTNTSAAVNALTFNQVNQNLTVNAVISGTGEVTKTGGGQLTYGGGAAANTCTGLTTVSAGRLHLTKNPGTNALSGDLLINGGHVTWGQNNQIIDTAAISMSGATSVFNGTGVNAGQFALTETLTSLTITGGCFNAATGSVWTITGGLSFTGGGNTIFVGNNGSRLTVGSLSLTGMTATAGGTVATNNSFTLYGTNATQVTTLTVGAGGIALNGSVLNLRRGGAGQQGSKVVLNGDLITTGSVASSITEDLIANPAGTIALELSGSAGAVTRTITTGAGGADLTIGIPITNGLATPGSVVKSGIGALTTTRTNTWSGTTTVAQGALYLMGTQATSAVTVDAGAVVGGSGTIAGTLLLQGGLAPGSGGTTTGQLSTAATTWTGTSGMTVDLNGTGLVADLLSTPGLAQTLAGTLTVSSLINETPGQVFTILSGSAISGEFTGAPEGAVIPAGSTGRAVSISYATPGVVTLTALTPPAVTAIVPNNGPTTTQMPVTITGTLFDPAATVTIGGNPATSVVWVNSTTITAVTPTGTQGLADVVVTNPDTQRGTLVGGYAYTGLAPTLVSLSPAFGPAQSTTVVTISGTNFWPGSAVAVSVGGMAATAVTYDNDTTITATFPAMSALSSDATPDVVVTSGDRQQATLANGFTYVMRAPENPSSTQAGLAYRYHRVGGPLIPAFDALVPFYQGNYVNATLTGINPFEARNDNWSAELNGYVTVPDDGIYTFFTESDDGSRLYIGTTLVVNNNFAQGLTERSGQIALTAGAHQVRVEFAQGNGGWGLFTRWQGPTVAKADIPDLAFTCDSTPVITTITPASGPQGGGTDLVIAGSGFVPGSVVLIGGTFAVPAVVLNATTITVTTPGGPVGAQDVVVMGPRSPGVTLTGGFTYVSSAAPTLTAIAPAAGTVFGGTPVTLTVSNIGVTPTVTFNGVAATSVVLVNATTVTCVTPAMPLGDATADVTVTAGGQSATLADGYTWNGLRVAENPTGTQAGLAYNYYHVAGSTLPNFSALTPFSTGTTGVTAPFGWTSNPIEPGYNSDFSLRWLGYLTVPSDGIYTLYTSSDDGSRLYIGSTLVVENNFAQGVTERSGVIALSAGSHLVTVEFAQGGGGYGMYVAWQGPNLTKANIPTDAFTTDPTPTITSLSVPNGPQSGGTAVTITGSGFTSAVTVTFGGTPAVNVVVSNGGTTIQCLTPSHAVGLVAVTVTNLTGTTATLAGAFTYDASAGPTITSITPATGPAGGGTPVTIIGNNFGAPMTVTIGGQAATNVQVVDLNTLTAETPTMSSASLVVDVTVANGAAQSTTLVGGFTYSLRVPENPTNLEAGLTYRYHRVGGPLLPTFTGLTPYSTGIRNTATIIVGNPGAANPFDTGYNQTWSVEYRGYITVPTDGIYTFFTESDDGSQLLLGSGVVVANNFAQGMTERSGSIGLLAGTHQLGVRFAQGTGNFGMNVRWQGPSIAKALIPDNILWTDARPTFALATPNVGTSAGGNTITITGTGFTSGTTVTIGGTAATGVVVASDGLSLTAVVPAHAAGLVPIVIANGNGLAVTQNNAYLYQGAAPTITGVSPLGGPMAGGTNVFIYGTNFSAGATVTIGGVAATNVVVGAGVISATTPAGARGPAVVTVLNVDTQSASRSPGYYFQGPTPTITSLTNTNGPLAGGTTLTVVGTGFFAGATATFDGVAATGVTVVNATTITLTTPANAQGPSDLVVSNVDLLSATRTNAFIFEGPAPTIAGITPTSGLMAGGTTVTISGTDFVGASVTFGGANASVVAQTGTSITVTTPAGAQGFTDVVVRNVDLLTATLTNGYIFLGAPPVITGVNPMGVPNNLATPITISGSGFVPGILVTIGGVPATVTSVTGTAVVVTMPSGLPPGPAAVEVTNIDLQTVVFTGFVAQGPAPILTGIDVPFGPVAGGRRMTLTGSAFRAGAIVTIGGVPATVLSITPTTIVALTPAHGEGAVTVTVTNDDLLSSSLVNAYSYYTKNDNSTAGNGCGTGGGLAVFLLLSLWMFSGGFAHRRR